MAGVGNDWTKLESVFLHAIDLPEAERSDYLASACRGDEELKQHVQEMLAADREERLFVDRPVILHAAFAEDDDRKQGKLTTIGRYKLLQEIGEGGLGVVYMAEQLEPVRRKVALKIIKPGMDSRAVTARFEAERQALALMDHPHIARVLDGGETETGTPYFVMDLVRGVSITDYCDSLQLPTARRLELFEAVCHAIQHAHQKGVIHRDIKPSNVMVTLNGEAPVPKVIDFGVAKALNRELTEKTLFTHYGAIIGTPQYMSPEQAAMSDLDVDTRSDIYSLGVLLYELLTGQPPFGKEQLRRAGLDGMRRIICNTPPTKPSTFVKTLSGERLLEVSRLRQLEPTNLSRTLQGDLDLIVMKAIDKDRAQRYGTAAELAQDVQCYLNNEPVKASPPTWRYQAYKFASRNRGLLAVAGVVLAALICGVGVAAHGWLTAMTANQELGRTQQQLVTQLSDAAMHASASQLGPAIANLAPVAQQAEPRLRAVLSSDSTALIQKINALIALGELDHSAHVGDFLLQHIASMEGNYCASLTSVLRATKYGPEKLRQFASAAEQDLDLETKSKIAILGMHLGEPSIAEEMLNNGLDPIQRTTLLTIAPNWHDKLTELVTLIDGECSSDFRSGVIQFVGMASETAIDPQTKDAWTPTLLNSYGAAPDLQTRNSAEWILRRWNLDVVEPSPTEPSPDRDWHVNLLGMTMRRVNPGRFTMGSWTSEFKIEAFHGFHDETPRQVAITRPFYLADRETSRRLFERWLATERGATSIARTDGTARVPASSSVGWVNVRLFCNWLSRREGLEEYYHLEPQTVDKYRPRKMSLRHDANGYRMPTEAEWEYACRAGTITDHSWGQSEQFAHNFVAKSGSPSGSTLPNPWGLFDMHGNQMEPCDDRYYMYPLGTNLLSLFRDPSETHREGLAVLRGRSMIANAHRSSSRDHIYIYGARASWPEVVGFRVARNAPAEPTEPAPIDNKTRQRELRLAVRLNEPSDVAPHLAERMLCCLRMGRTEEAADEAVALLQVTPLYEDWGSLRSQLLTLLSGETSLIDELSRRMPENLHLTLCRARYAAFRGRWGEAARLVEPILRKPNLHESRWLMSELDPWAHECALYLLHGGLVNAYREYRSWLIAKLEGAPENERLRWMVWRAASLAPIEDRDEQQAVLEIADRVNNTFGGGYQRPEAALAFFRAGKYAATAELIEQKLATERGNAFPGDPRTAFLLAMTYWQLGRRDAACTLLEEANQDSISDVLDLSNGWPELRDYWKSLTAILLRQEAERMIECKAHTGE